MTSTEIAILIKPLVAPVFYALVTAPIMWVLFRVIPNGKWKVVLFKVRDGPEATPHDRAVQLWAAIAANALLWTWAGIVAWY